MKPGDRPDVNGTSAPEAAATSFLRRTARLAPVRSLHRALQRSPSASRTLNRIVAGSAVSPSWLFVLRETLRSDATGSYRVRTSPTRLALRHGSDDIDVFIAIFARREYEPPLPVRELLDAKRGAPVVLDLGAHVGLFGARVLQWCDAQIVSVEPDPESFRALSRCIDRSGLSARWSAIRACAGSRDGVVRFLGGRGWASHVVVDGQVAPHSELTPKVDVFPFLQAGVDLLKMDIEGGEWEILSDPRLRTSPLRAVVLEYHSRFAPGGETARDAALRLLREAAFTATATAAASADQGIIWAWRGDP